MKHLQIEKQVPFLSDLPKKPGVYFFKDAEAHILYIGKATSIYNRVKSYFSGNDMRPNVAQLLEKVHSVEYIETKNTHEALLLEASLILEHKPPFNILIKEGNPFLYIFFNTKADPHRLQLVRNKTKKSGIYFGPFLQKKSTRSAYEFLIREFKLELCGKKREHGCLSYHIGRCAGSCKNDFDLENYMIRLALVVSMLKGDKKEFGKIIKNELQKAIKNLEFERAQHFVYYQEHMEYFFKTLEAQKVFQETQDEVFAVATKFPQYSSDYEIIAQELQEMTEAKKPIYSIDCFDISHNQGKFIVGSSIRFNNGKPVPNEFRKFKIKTLEDQNDYAALSEIVSRRYKEAPLPDLIIIDGGKGQENSIKKLHLDTNIVALAKKEERLFTQKFPEGLVLSKHKKSHLLLIAMRDYAHHFAVTYHKNLRSKNIT